jgi:hypothetical protein
MSKEQGFSIRLGQGAQIFPPHLRKMLYEASMVEPEKPIGASFSRSRAIDDAARIIRESHPEFFSERALREKPMSEREFRRLKKGSA